MTKLFALVFFALVAQVCAQSTNLVPFRPLLGLNIDKEIRIRGELVSAWEEAIKLRLNSIELSLQWVFKNFTAKDHASKKEHNLSPVFMFWWFGDHAHYSTQFEELIPEISDYFKDLERFVEEVLSTYTGDVYIVLEPEYNIGFLRKSPRFGLLMAEAAEHLRGLVRNFPRVNLKIGLGLGDFGNKLKSEDGQEWSTYEPSLQAAAPTMDFLSFIEMPRQYKFEESRWECGQKSDAEWEQIHQTLPLRALNLAQWLKNKYDRTSMLHYYNALYHTTRGHVVHAKLLQQLQQLNDEYVNEGLFAITPLNFLDDHQENLYHGGHWCDEDNIGGIVSHVTESGASLPNPVLNKAGHSFLKWSESHQPIDPRLTKIVTPPPAPLHKRQQVISDITKISSVYPSNSIATGGVKLTVFGSGFSKGPSSATPFCIFGGEVGTNASIISDSVMVCVSPNSAGRLGTVDFQVTVDGVTYSPPVNFLWYMIRPVIAFVTPSTAPVTGNTIVTIGGAYFSKQPDVFNLRCQFGSTQPTPAVLLSPDQEDQVICQVPPVLRAKVVNLRLFFNGATLSTPVPFEYVWNAPRLTRILPTNRGSATGGNLVTVVGVNFNHYFYAWCKFGPNPPTDAQVVRNSAYTRVICPAPPSTVVDCVNLAVSNDGVTYSNFLPYCFDQEVPRVFGLFPSTAPVNQPKNVTVIGDRFSKGLPTFCSFGAFPAVPANVYNSTLAYCLSPLLNVSDAGVYSFRLITQQNANTSTPSAETVSFKFTAATPVAQIISPASGPFIGGTSVTIQGLGFLNVTQTNLTCFFGSKIVPATFVSKTQVVCVSPPADVAGPVNVSVGNDIFAGSNYLNFTYLPFTPNITSLSPSHAPVYGGVNVFITGIFLSDRETYVCRFGELIVAATLATPTTLTCLVPPATDATKNVTALYDGLVALTVSNTNGDAGSNVLYFRYVIPVPTVVDISPPAGPSGTTVTIRGRDFFPGTKFRCQVDGDLYSFATKIDDTTMTCVIPRRKKNLSATVVVRVTNDLISFSQPLWFGYSV